MPKEGTKSVIKRFQVPLIARDSRLQTLTDAARIKPRMIVASMGRQGTGKSYWLLTAPQPIAIIDLDEGLSRAVQGRADVLEASVEEYTAEIPIHASRYRKPWLELRNEVTNEDDLAAAAADQLQQMRSDYLYALRDYRTVCVDGTSDLYETVRLAIFGRTEQITKLNYGPINREMKLWMDRARESDANVVFTHRVRDDYLGDEKTGKDKLRGWEDVLYEVDMVLEHVLDDEAAYPDSFRINVVKCGMNPKLRGSFFSGADAGFQTIAQKVFPQSKPSDWE